MKVCITGGRGFIGSKLASSLLKAGHKILIIDRNTPGQTSPGINYVSVDLLTQPIPVEVLDCDAIVHLAGVSIFNKWTPEYKKLISDSRIKTAEALLNAIKAAGGGPKIFVCSSGVGYYGEGGENTLDESASPGKDFLAQVCVEWEKVAKSSTELGMRWVSVRTAGVIGPGGGMIAKFIPYFKWFVGGTLSSGKQWFSWIHVDDLVEVYKAAVEDSRLSGPINAAAPQIIRNKDFTKALGRALHRPSLIRVPKFILKLILGQLAEFALMSQKVVPKKLERINFQFRYPTIDDALRDL
jgi:uncharacterized protein